MSTILPFALHIEAASSIGELLSVAVAINTASQPIPVVGSLTNLLGSTFEFKFNVCAPNFLASLVYFRQNQFQLLHNPAPLAIEPKSNQLSLGHKLPWFRQ